MEKGKGEGTTPLDLCEEKRREKKKGKKHPDLIKSNKKGRRGQLFLFL